MAAVQIVIEVLRKVRGYALPIRVRNMAGDAFKSRREIGCAVCRRTMSLRLALLKELQTLADNFITGLVASTADLFRDQALEIRA